MIHAILNRFSLLLATMIFAFSLASCGGNVTETSVASSLDDAEQLLADGRTNEAARICADLMANDFDKLDENQLGRMAILYMKLPETESVSIDENVADAPQCVRHALKISIDSLRGFLSTLSPEDLPLFVMLTRISGSIDFPPDLSEEYATEYLAEDSIQVNP